MSSPWWKTGTIYQIYPKSFRDASGDGVGDIRGIEEKLPYLQDLGVDILWLSPIFASPMIDNGYDISDYKTVNPLFGTMEDFESFLDQARRRSLKIVLDIAFNHTSTQHPWFEDACAGGDKRDWYIWRDGDVGGPPNNWVSIFGGPAWSQTEPGGQYYLHMFDRTQADLNWENPAVRDAIYDAMRFWLDKGVAGFRLDVVTQIAKPKDFADVPSPIPAVMFWHMAGQERLKDHLREMRREVFAHYDCVAIGEAPGVDPQRTSALVDPADPMLDMLYHFDFVEPISEPSGAWDRRWFKQTFGRWDAGVGPRGWNSVVLSNHDLGRVVSRFGDEDFRYESATMLAMLVLTQRATPFLYQGDELGLVNAAFEGIDQIDDVWARTMYRLKRDSGASETEGFAAALAVTRDHARTPFPWDNSANLGFSDASPWLLANPRHAEINAAAQIADPVSVRAFVKRLLALRRADPLWSIGAFVDLAPEHPDLFVYARELDGRRGHVALNLRGHSVALLPEAPREAPSLRNTGNALETLAPFEARLWAPS